MLAFLLWAFTSQLRGDAGCVAQRHARVTDLRRFQRGFGVLLDQLLIVHGTDALGVLRRTADELEEFRG